MQPTIYPDLNDVLADLVERVVAILGAECVAIYLHGSFALGAGDQDSDVDFLVLVERELSSSQIAALNAMHASIYQQPTPWAQHLEGSYIPKDLFRTADQAKTPVPYLDNGSQTLEVSNHDNELVVRWQVRERGIALYGAPAKTLIEPIDPAALRQEIRTTMQEWGAEITSGRYTIANRWAQPFVVLSYCRMLQTLAIGSIESKQAGAAWAQQQLDPQWHSLIQHALQERPDPSTKYRQPADPAAVEQTVAFVRYACDLAVAG